MRRTTRRSSAFYRSKLRDLSGTLPGAELRLIVPREPAYKARLPLLQRAVQQLSGTSSLGEAHADYNLAYTRYELGQCADVLALLERSQRIQGHRTEIDALRRDAQNACDRLGE